MEAVSTASLFFFMITSVHATLLDRCPSAYFEQNIDRFSHLQDCLIHLRDKYGRYSRYRRRCPVKRDSRRWSPSFADLGRGLSENAFRVGFFISTRQSVFFVSSLSLSDSALICFLICLLFLLRVHFDLLRSINC